MAGRDSVAADNEQPSSNRVGRFLLFLLIVGALAVGGFFLLGGSADVDTEGDFEVPEVDVDVNAPEVDVNSEDAPPASADADSTSSN